MKMKKGSPVQFRTKTVLQKEGRGRGRNRSIRMGGVGGGIRDDREKSD